MAKTAKLNKSAKTKRDMSATKAKAKAAVKPKIRIVKAPEKSRTDVISFRVTKQHVDTLTKRFDECAIPCINSPKQLARKVLCDFLANRLVYTNPEDAKFDVDFMQS